jgi:hypothetical protein
VALRPMVERGVSGAGSAQGRTGSYGRPRLDRPLRKQRVVKPYFRIWRWMIRRSRPTALAAWLTLPRYCVSRSER